jgi:hypothetical protein
VVQNRPDRQKIRWEHLVSAGRLCVSNLSLVFLAHDILIRVRPVPATGSPVTLTLPNQVEPGDYLVRHEIISLQLAVSLGGAEFYPSCTQIRVGGSQTGTPNQTVSFPGAYSDNDPGIYDPNVYNSGSSYVFPGPPVSNLASSSDMSTSNGGQNNGNPSSSPTSPASPASPDSTTTGKGAKPTQSGAQGTKSSDRLCTLQRRNAPLARRSGLAQHMRNNLMRALRNPFRHS